jgi:hypothetical protein
MRASLEVASLFSPCNKHCQNGLTGRAIVDRRRRPCQVVPSRSRAEHGELIMLPKRSDGAKFGGTAYRLTLGIGKAAVSALASFNTSATATGTSPICQALPLLTSRTTARTDWFCSTNCGRQRCLSPSCNSGNCVHFCSPCK